MYIYTHEYTSVFAYLHEFHPPSLMSFLCCSVHAFVCIKIPAQRQEDACAWVGTG